MIHDLDLTVMLMGREPQSLQAHFAYCHPNSDAEAEDVVQTVLSFSNGVFAVVVCEPGRAAQGQGVHDHRALPCDRGRLVAKRHHCLPARRERAAIDDGPGYRQQTIIEIPFVPRMDEPLVTQLDRFADLATGRADAEAELSSLLAPHELIAQAQASADTARAQLASTVRS